MKLQIAIEGGIHPQYCRSDPKAMTEEVWVHGWRTLKLYKIKQPLKKSAMT